MNCKEGDVAIVVKSAAGNEGKVVTCLRYVGNVPEYWFLYNDMWEVDTPMNILRRVDDSTVPCKAYYASDSQLRPLPKLREVDDMKEEEKLLLEDFMYDESRI